MYGINQQCPRSSSQSTPNPFQIKLPRVAMYNSEARETHTVTTCCTLSGPPLAHATLADQIAVTILTQVVLVLSAEDFVIVWVRRHLGHVVQSQVALRSCAMLLFSQSSVILRPVLRSRSWTCGSECFRMWCSSLRNVSKARTLMPPAPSQPSPCHHL